jgi:ATP-dependent Clp protease adaptor protein ClpS
MGSLKADTRSKTETEIREKTAEPPLYKVVLHNDDFTTKLFVVEILMMVFNKSMEQASQLMWHVHHHGRGVCGIYPLEIAETKAKTVITLARENGFPLKTSVEEE